eukprot:GHVN01075178.1.p1 GENE.GHVN01075178.1~~GHVN01075178.1.p1  ORF type:complete len:176 (-),score=21.48 GHVN01075178.1:280-807(-)
MEGMEGVDQRGIKDTLEGPKSLRMLCFIGGCLWFGFGLLSLINIFKILFKPLQFVIEMYITLMGLAVVVVEFKGFGIIERLGWARKCQDWFLKWMPFLSVMLGKGIFYIVGGGLGISLWFDNLFVFASSIYMMGLGLLLCFLHCGRCGENSSRFNVVVDMETGGQAQGARPDYGT